MTIDPRGEDPRDVLGHLVQRFVEGHDRSSALAGQIEGLLIEFFADTDLYEELITPLASYQPGGGEGYYGEEELAAELRQANVSHPMWFSSRLD